MDQMRLRVSAVRLFGRALALGAATIERSFRSQSLRDEGSLDPAPKLLEAALKIADQIAGRLTVLRTKSSMRVWLRA